MSKEKHSTKRKLPVKTILTCILIILCIALVANIQHTQIASIVNVNEKDYLVAKEEPIKEGKVTITYKDTTGKEIMDQKVITGKLGETYETSRPDILGYKAYGEDPVNKIGNFDDVDVVVNFVYEETQNSVNTTTDGKVVNVEVLKDKGEELQEIQMSIVTEDEESNIIRGAKYIVSRSNGTVIRNATSYSDKLIVGKLTLLSEGIDKFDILQLVAPEGYSKIDDKIKLELEKVYNDETKKYEVSARIIDNENATVEVQNNEIVITIKNKKDTSTKPEEPENPEEPEKPEEPEDKVFDLEINKYLTHIKVDMAGKIIEKDKDKNNNELVKVDVPKNKINDTTLEVTYEIEVKNVGEVAGYATEITDKIPDGMVILENEDWFLQNNEAISNLFENKLLQPGESELIPITFSYKLSEQNIGTKINKAIISAYYNEDGIEDKTPDNIAEENMIVTIKTGGKIFITLELIGILAIVTFLVILKKRKSK